MKRTRPRRSLPAPMLCSNRERMVPAGHSMCTATSAARFTAGSMQRRPAAERRPNQPPASWSPMGSPGREVIFKAYFSSCCGGIAQSAADAFGDDNIPPLADQNRGKCCSDSPKFNWGPIAIPEGRTDPPAPGVGRVAETTVQKTSRRSPDSRSLRPADSDGRRGSSSPTPAAIGIAFGPRTSAKRSTPMPGQTGSKSSAASSSRSITAQTSSSPKVTATATASACANGVPSTRPDRGGTTKPSSSAAFPGAKLVRAY